MLNNYFRFKKLNVLEKIQFVNIHQLCRNCLKSQHPIKSCKEKNNCKECNGQHNTLLHTENNEKQLKTYFLEKQESTFLATALVKFMSNNQDEHVLRALIDSGSQATFITEDAVQMLRLRKTRTITQITGIGESNKATSTSMVKLTIKPVFNSEFTIQINAFVLKKLTGVLPEQKFETNEFEQFQHLQLADPCFNIPKKIEMIIGVDVYTNILQEGLIRTSAGKAIAQNTKLGWIISGPVPKPSKNIRCSTITCNFKFDEVWENFNETEIRILTKEEQKCEDIYRLTHQKTKDDGISPFE
ncbi:MAG TPA: hypothetical protein DDZ41_06255, partial [Flavobacterium sp.]|nr:hypothetical protein [Flavobacterium sp.]